jgi:threonine efflux protein
MLANGWIFELLRYAGAGYLLFLAFKSARSALRPGSLTMQEIVAPASPRPTAADCCYT